MGYFLAVSAFKTDSVSEVANAIADYVKSCGSAGESLPPTTPPNQSRDAQIYAPANGWTVVMWPEYFNIHDFPLIRKLAASRGWVISTIHVYDDAYWEHLCCSGGTELHAFSSRPHFWQEESPPDFERIAAYNSEPVRLASALGVPPSEIQPYFVDVDSLADAGAKAHPDDEFALGNFWVFTDFWGRLGIAYPDPPQNMVAVLRLGFKFTNKLPVG